MVPHLFISVAAGTSIATFEDVLGAQSPIVRAMPNTPAAVGPRHYRDYRQQPMRAMRIWTAPRGC